jgi:DNA mismatch endonuclease (patch repair protein)
MMAAVKQRDTKPELAVRRALHAMGLRFRLNRRDLPGSPDIVLTRWRTVVFVHGCFWHRHNCRWTTTPATRVAFWRTKFQRNVERDQTAVASLQRAGWRVLTIWGCQAKSSDKLRRRLARLFRREEQGGR